MGRKKKRCPVCLQKFRFLEHHRRRQNHWPEEYK